MEHSPLNREHLLCLLVVWVWLGGCGTALCVVSMMPFPECTCDWSSLRRRLICPGSVCMPTTCSRLLSRHMHPAFYSKHKLWSIAAAPANSCCLARLLHCIIHAAEEPRDLPVCMPHVCAVGQAAVIVELFRSGSLQRLRHGLLQQHAVLQPAMSPAAQILISICLAPTGDCGGGRIAWQVQSAGEHCTGRCVSPQLYALHASPHSLHSAECAAG